jgi:broad specificity phosphatase PhoE
VAARRLQAGGPTTRYRPGEMRRMILTRHAQSEFNARGRLNADPSIPSGLTDEGVQQARRLERALSVEAIDLCATSEFARAIDTADLALVGRGIPRVSLADLNEPLAPAFEGLPAERYDEWLQAHGSLEPNPGGGESQIDALARYVRAFRTLADRDESVILVVAHALPIAWLRAGWAVARGEAERPRIDFTDPAVPFTTPYTLSVDEVVRAADALEALLPQAVRPPVSDESGTAP